MNPPALRWPGACGANGRARSEQDDPAADDPPRAARDEPAEAIEGEQGGR